MKATEQELLDLIDNNPQLFFGMKRLGWFKDWLVKDNLHVYHAFESWAVEHRTTLQRHYFSARAIIEIMRWNTLTRDSTAEFKLSDHCMPYLARLVMLRRTELEGMFKLCGPPPPSLDDLL